MKKIIPKTTDITQQNINQIAQLFPQVITEKEDENGNTVKAIDFELLKQHLSNDIVEGSDERYRLDWPGKRASILKANTPITSTLKPDRESSVNFDTTENVYIEGDNFEVLKILQESYLGKVKMIYIDPPYNTGKDFVYKDNFKVSKDDYEEELGTEDEEGGKLFKNTDTNGRFLSDWLSMMYERLLVARDLLTEDGVIFMSIDDNEIDNLLKISKELFNEDSVKTIAVKMSESSGLKMNSVKKLGTIPKLKEYIVLIKKDGIQDLFIKPIKKEKWDTEYNIFLEGLTKENRSLINLIQQKDNINDKDILTLDKMISKVEIKSVSDKLKELKISSKDKDKWLFRNSWRICQSTTSASVLKLAKIKREVNKSDLFFVLSATKLVYLVKSGFDKNSKKPRLQLIFADDNLTQHPGDFWSHIKTTGLDNEGDVPFKNGKKPIKLLKALLESKKDEEQIILDFFSGSASTAEAILRLSLEDAKKRKFIMVQLPEDLDLSIKKANSADLKKSLLASIQFLDELNKPHLITEIGKERIRRAGKKILEENADKLKERKTPLDVGFRVYKTSPSILKEVAKHPSQITQANLFASQDNIKEDASPEDILTSVILDFGLTLDHKITTQQIAGSTIFIVDDNALVACFDTAIAMEVVDAMANIQPIRAVFRDACFKDDKDLINTVESRFKQIAPNTKVHVI